MHYLTFVAVEIPPYVEDLEENKKVERAIEDLREDDAQEKIMKDIYLECLFERKTTFGRLVSDAVDETLAPFGQDSEDYQEFFDMTEEIKQEYENGKDDFYKTPDGKFKRNFYSVDGHQFVVRDKKVYEYVGKGKRQELRTKLAKKMKAYPDYPNKKAYKSFEDYAENGRYENYDEKHKAYGYYCNPNTVYDWYAIGGRWFDCLLVKDSCVDVYLCDKKREDEPAAPKGYKWVAGARMKDIEWDLMLKLQKDRLTESYEKYKKWFAEKVLPEKTYCTLCSDGIRSWNGMEYCDGDTLEAFLERKGISPDVKYPSVCYGYFYEGSYNERWCYTTAEEKGHDRPEIIWQKEVDLYLDGLNPDDVLVGVDIHI